jgi:hypothetical protein
MTNRFHEGDQDALERHLARLRTDLVFPKTPDIASSLRLNDMPGPPEPSRTMSHRVAPWSWTVLAAAAVMIGILAFAVPGTRSTLASWFDFPGIRIEVGTDEQPPPAPPTSIGGTLLLGKQVTTADATKAARFEIVVPVAERITGTPETYLLDRDGAMIVSLLYPASPKLPEIGTTGVGILLMQIDSPDATTVFAKRSMNEQSPVSVKVNGEMGTWIEGGTLTIEPVYASGTFERSSGNVLIWERNGVTYRMESALTMTDAVALAEGLQPLPTISVPEP